MAVSLNRGGNPPIFEHIGQVCFTVIATSRPEDVANITWQVVPTHDGYDAPDVRIAGKPRKVYSVSIRCGSREMRQTWMAMAEQTIVSYKTMVTYCKL